MKSTGPLGLLLVVLAQAQATSYGTPSYGTPNCEYDCQSDGGCEVRWTGPSRRGNTKGSCFPPSFGGTCSGTPRECDHCSSHCRAPSAPVCSCNGNPFSNECKAYNGKRFCYVDQGQCHDEKKTKRPVHDWQWYWSYEACREFREPPPPPPPLPSCKNIYNRQCIFPFKYDGKYFHQCTTYKSVNGQPWCATKVDSAGNADCGRGSVNCADCSERSLSQPECLPLEPTLPPPQPLPSASCKNIHNRQCVFPFRIEGREFTKCTTFNSENGQPWCATKVDSAGNADCGRGSVNCADCSERSLSQPECHGDRSPLPPTQCTTFKCHGERSRHPQGPTLPPPLSSTLPPPSASCKNIYNSQCIFPFRYLGKEFTQCTTYPSFDQPWCATKVDSAGNANCRASGDCANCSERSLSQPECLPLGPTPPPPQPHPGASQNIHNRECIFPFRIDGREFTKCTTYKSEWPWCPTKVDSAGNADCDHPPYCGPDSCSASPLQRGRGLPWPAPVPAPAPAAAPVPATPAPARAPAPAPVPAPVPDSLPPITSAFPLPTPHNPQCKKMRVRKSVHRLTSTEKQRLRYALESAIANKTAWMNFPDIANFHGWPTLCSSKPSHFWGCCPHRTGDFIAWHRLYMVQLEEVLEPWLADTNLGLPYWDWSLDSRVPDLWESVQSPIKDAQNSLEEWDSTVCKEQDKHYAQRVRPDQMEKMPATSLLADQVYAAMEEDDFFEFSDLISNPHGSVHNGLKCTMKPQQIAAYDPVFWLHHSFVDKVAADWQKRNREPLLDNHAILEPFGSNMLNKYPLTFKTPAQTLDYQNNLCYCYDCDFPPSASAVASPPDCFGPWCGWKSYVAMVVPHNFGGREVAYKLCRQEDDGQEDCIEGSIALFGPSRQPDIDPKVNAENFMIKKDRVWTRPDVWTRVKLLEGGDLVPEKTPPFIIHRTGEEKLVQLQRGARREDYGDLLDSFTVLNYCDTFEDEKIGHPSICG